jgi:hypothetical protein
MVTPSISLSHSLTSAESTGGGVVQLVGHWAAAKLTGKEQGRSEEGRGSEMKGAADAAATGLARAACE